MLRTARGTDAVRVTCNLTPTGRSWNFAAWRTVGRMLYRLHAVDRADWLFTPEELQLDGLEMEKAIGPARDLVLIASGGRFRPQDAPPEPPIHVPPLPHQTRMERSD